MALTGVLALAVAFLLAVLSVFVQRTGPEMAAYGNQCGPTTSDPCLEPQLKGGFPLAFLFDTPGVSVEHQLSFGEDHFQAGGFGVDVAIDFVVAFVLLRKGRGWLRRAGGSRLTRTAS